MPFNNITELNSILSKSNAGWRAKENKITRMKPEERRNLLGLSVDRAMLAELAAQPRTLEAIFGLPAGVDWRSFNGHNHVSPVKDQANCGSCVSFCVCATMESMVSIAGGNPVDLSEADLHFCSNHGASCGGWWPTDAIAEARRRGVPDEARFPYMSAFGAGGPSCQIAADRDGRLYRPGDMVTLQTTAERKQWLATRGPVCAAIQVYDDFFAIGTDVYRHVTGNHAGYHCIEVIGYSDADQCWIAKNSWGPTWGDNGFFRIGYGECGIDDTSQDRDPSGALNRFPMFGIKGVQIPSEWRAFTLAGANSVAAAGGITAVSRIPGSMEVWWIAPNGSVQAAYWYDGGSWAGYELAPAGSASPSSGISAVSRIPGSMELWWVAPNGSVQAAFWYEGGNWNRYELSGPGSAAPSSKISAVSRIPNSMELWWVGPNESVQSAYWYDGGNWNRYELAPAGSASRAGGISAVSRIPGSMELWWIAPNGSIQSAYWYEGGNWNRYELSGAGSGSPTGGLSAVSRIPGSMELWWVAPNGSIQSGYWYEGGNWNRYELAPGGSASPSTGISSVSRIPGSMELWWVGQNGSIQANFWYEGGNWNRYELAPAGSAPPTAGVAAVSRIAGSMELWWTAADGSLRDNYWYG